MSRGLRARRPQCAGMKEIVGLRNVRRAQDREVLYVQAIDTATSIHSHRRSRGGDVEAEKSGSKST